METEDPTEATRSSMVSLKVESEDSDDDSFDPEEETLLEFDPPQWIDGPTERNASIQSDNFISLSMKKTKFTLQPCPSDRPLKGIKGHNKEDEIDKILNSIHGPQEWIDDDNNRHYIRYVSRVPAYPSKAVELDHRLDILLTERGGGHPGSLCPVRRQLFDDCFDELIRQVTLSTPERGMMLVRCRDELRATRTAYCELFAGSECFLSRKCIRGSNPSLLKTVDILRVEMVTVKQVWAKLQDSLRSAISKNAEEVEKLERKHNEELEYFKVTNVRLKTQIEHFANPSRGLTQTGQPSENAQQHKNRKSRVLLNLKTSEPEVTTILVAKSKLTA